MRSPCREVFAQNSAFSHSHIGPDFLSLPDAPTQSATATQEIIVKYCHSNRSSYEFRPTWCLALLARPVIIVLILIVAGSGIDQQSNLSQGQPGVSATAPMGASGAGVGKTTAPP